MGQTEWREEPHRHYWFGFQRFGEREFNSVFRVVRTRTYEHSTRKLHPPIWSISAWIWNQSREPHAFERVLSFTLAKIENLRHTCKMSYARFVVVYGALVATLMLVLERSKCRRRQISEFHAFRFRARACEREKKSFPTMELSSHHSYHGPEISLDGVRGRKWGMDHGWNKKKTKEKKTLENWDWLPRDLRNVALSCMRACHLVSIVERGPGGTMWAYIGYICMKWGQSSRRKCRKSGRRKGYQSCSLTVEICEGNGNHRSARFVTCKKWGVRAKMCKFGWMSEKWDISRSCRMSWTLFFFANGTKSER